MKYLRQILSESHELLLEYDRYKTIQQHGEKALNVALARDEHDSYLNDIQGLNSGHVRGHPDIRDKPPREQAMHELMGQFEEVDPTPQKKYVQHIARIYGNGGVPRHEDIYARMKPALRDFHDLASRKVLPADKRDIGRYKSLSDIEDIVDAHKDKTSSRQNDKAYHDKMKTQAEITEHPNFTHIIPKTAAAAAHFGKGTRWCTATDNPEDSLFDQYKDDGPLQIMIPKKPAYKGEKYQYHYSTGQMMDEKDEPVENDETPHRDINKFVKNYETKMKRALTNPTKDHPESSVRKKYWTTKASADDAIDHALSPHSTLDESDAIFDRHDLEPKHLNRMLDSEDNSITFHAAGHRRANAQVLTKAMNHSHWDTRYNAILNKNHNESHVDKAVNDKSVEVVAGAADSPHLKPHHIDAILNAKNLVTEFPGSLNHERPLERLGYNPVVKGKHLETLLNHDSANVRRTALSNANLKRSQLMNALSDKDLHVRIGARKRYMGISPSVYHYLDHETYNDEAWNAKFNGEPPEEKENKSKRLQDITFHGKK